VPHPRSFIKPYFEGLLIPISFQGEIRRGIQIFNGLFSTTPGQLHQCWSSLVSDIKSITLSHKAWYDGRGLPNGEGGYV